MIQTSESHRVTQQPNKGVVTKFILRLFFFLRQVNTSWIPGMSITGSIFHNLPHTLTMSNWDNDLLFHLPACMMCVANAPKCTSTRQLHLVFLHLFPEPGFTNCYAGSKQEAAGRLQGDLQTVIQQRNSQSHSAEPKGAPGELQQGLEAKLWGLPSAPGGAAPCDTSSKSLCKNRQPVMFLEWGGDWNVTVSTTKACEWANT